MATGGGNSETLIQLFASAVMVAGGVALSKAAEQVTKYLERREARRDALIEENVRYRMMHRMEVGNQLDRKTDDLETLIRKVIEEMHKEERENNETT
ncbi:MAG: hypothetical protein ACPG7F_16770 [Aggregatilineales bacterium]